MIVSNRHDEEFYVSVSIIFSPLFLSFMHLFCCATESVLWHTKAFVLLLVGFALVSCELFSLANRFLFFYILYSFSLHIFFFIISACLFLSLVCFSLLHVDYSIRFLRFSFENKNTFQNTEQRNDWTCSIVLCPMLHMHTQQLHSRTEWRISGIDTLKAMPR